MIGWIVWAALLVLQNASFTWVSRARNSGSIHYHAIAAVGSNGIYIVSFGFMIDRLWPAIRDGDLNTTILVSLFYVAFTVTGSLLAHHLLMKYVESGNRRVGSPR